MLYEKLFDWQRKIVERYEDRENLGLFLDMGLGKTPLALGFAELHNCTKIMIITLNGKVNEKQSVSGSWRDWISQMKFEYQILGKKKNVLSTEDPQVLVVNYEHLFNRGDARKKSLLRQSVVEFINSCKGHNTALIVDESHKLKNHSSLQTKSIKAIQKKLEGKANKTFSYLLTGTPFTKGYMDLLTQLQVLGAPLSIGDFRANFCNVAQFPFLEMWEQPIIGYKNTDKLYEIIHHYAITLKSEEVITLPEQIFNQRVLPISKQFELLTKIKIKGEINPYYRNISYPEKTFDCNDYENPDSLLWLRARQMSIGFQGNGEHYVWYDRSRLDLLKKILTDHEDNYILFYNYTPEMFEIFKICEELGYNIDIYSGDIKSQTFYDKYEQQSVDQRVTNRKNINIVNYASGAAGKNWQLYNKCIRFSTPTFSDWAQASKRIHRIGQESITIYDVLTQNNWLEKEMNDALESAQDYDTSMFNKGLSENK